MYKRPATLDIINRLSEKRRFIQIIIGPRQVGKTTAILQVLENFPTSHYAACDLVAPPLLSWIATQWEIARNKLKESEQVILVLDEVQKIGDWSTEVKRLWDEDTKEKCNLLVVILGSSSLLIQHGLNESLAGRFEIIKFPHWSWTECKDSFGFSLDEYIYFGGYPAGAGLINDETRWKHYVCDSLIETAISKDILLLNRVEKPALLRQLFLLACEYGSQVLSYQKIMGQLHDAGNTTTLAHYKKLLESAYLLRGLEKWSGKTLRRRGSSPKWIPATTALVTALSNRSFQDWKSEPSRWGRLVEITVGAHLINLAPQNDISVYYWNEGNAEVDFVLEKGKKLLAIEVKSGKNPHRRPFFGLEKFKVQNKSAQSLVISDTEIPLKTFLEKPLLDWL